MAATCRAAARAFDIAACCFLFLALGAATAAVAPRGTCPQVLQGTCMGQGTGPSSYAGFTATSPDECCAACQQDGTLCYGYTYFTSKRACQLLDAWNASLLHKGVCTTGKVNNWPQKPPPRTPSQAPKGAKNVLFIVADDMRPSLGPYAANPARSPYFTPNMNALAADGITFTRAYIQFSYVRMPQMSARTAASRNTG